jgi:hypothetical protein
MSIFSFGKGYEVDSSFKPKDNSRIGGNPFFLIDGDSTSSAIKIPIIGYSGKPITGSISYCSSEYGISLQKFKEGKVD